MDNGIFVHCRRLNALATQLLQQDVLPSDLTLQGAQLCAQTYGLLQTLIWGLQTCIPAGVHRHVREGRYMAGSRGKIYT